jgi:DNA-binding MarR family transcriptional regulator
MRPVPLPLDDQICFTLYATSIAVGRTYKPLLDSLGITYPQYLVLCAIGEGGETTVGSIAERLWLDPSTVTPLVKRMEATDLVARERGRSDERRVHVRLTEYGRSVLVKCNCLGEELIERSGMTLEQLNLLNRKIQRLHHALVPVT